MEFNFDEDIKDLRKSVLIFIIPFLILFALVFSLSKKIINIILILNNIDASNLIIITPLESIQTQINVSLIISLAICIPLLLVSIYLFCKPLIKQKLKIKNYIIFSIFLSWSGLLIGSTIFSNYLFKSFKYYTIANTMWSIKSVMSMILSFGISLSLIFQTMIIIPLIVKWGIVTRKELIKYSLFIFLIISILSAFITPPDIFSQIIVSIPFYLSFWVGILLSKLTGGKK